MNLATITAVHEADLKFLPDLALSLRRLADMGTTCLICLGTIYETYRRSAGFFFVGLRGCLGISGRSARLYIPGVRVQLAWVGSDIRNKCGRAQTLACL